MSATAILGPGGVGGFLAAVLTRGGEDVVVVAREETAEQLAAGGIQVESATLGAFSASPRTVAILREPASLLFVTTKSTTLNEALDRIEVEPDLVVPLLNGLEHMARLRERFGDERVAAATIRIEASIARPGQVNQTSPSVRVELAADDPHMRPSLQPVARMLEHAGIPATVEDGEAQVLWSKLVRLVALACTTSASDRPIGFVRSDPGWREALIACVEEAAAVANADGAQLDPADTVVELDDAHAELRSSMQRDIAAGREPELDAIAGAVIRVGRRHGIECPTIARLSMAIAERAGIEPPRFEPPPVLPV